MEGIGPRDRPVTLISRKTVWQQSLWPVELLMPVAVTKESTGRHWIGMPRFYLKGQDQAMKYKKPLLVGSSKERMAELLAGVLVEVFHP